jgi:hypothetical protein
MRAAEVPGLVSLKVTDLFPDIPQAIYLPQGTSQEEQDLSAVRKATRDALDKVDMSMIGAEQSVNICCSEHGFSIMRGWPYAEMLRTIKDVVHERTGCKNIRLKLCTGGIKTEFREFVPYYELDEYFDKVSPVTPMMKGVPIETEIGTLYGVAAVYDADWFIHAHYDDPRELHFHRLITRLLKPFTMSYARFETRSAFHMNFGSRSSNIIPRAIYDSPFVQNKFAFTCDLITAPSGVIGVGADNDLIKLDRKSTAHTLKSYGKLVQLIKEIDECVAVFDDERWPWYLHGGGLVSCELIKGPANYLDLDYGSPEKPYHKGFNPAIKALVVNYSYSFLYNDMAQAFPTILAGRAVADSIGDRDDGIGLKHAVIAENLEEAIQFAYRIGGTDKALVFDGNYGSFNLSPAMGEYLLKKAPAISEKVDNELLPMWLAQRGIDPKECDYFTSH